MSSTRLTSHSEISELYAEGLNALAERKKFFIVVTEETSHFDRSELNAYAEENVSSMLVQLATFHLDKSALKSGLLKNAYFIFVTRETSLVYK